jgi:23S rRNA (uridine2552-2'-O)-methyltransferase
VPGQYKRKDHFYTRAKKEAYASRAIYKLEELNRRFKLFRKSDYVLDLGCAPGSWLQFISEIVLPSGRVMGVDLLPLAIALPKEVHIFQGDFGDETVLDEMHALTEGRPFDAVVSDASPNLSGVLFADQERSLELNLQVIAVARRFLKPGGKLVVKSFEGENLLMLKAALESAFTDVKRFIPEATRKTSREVYWVAVKAIQIPQS